MASLVLNGNTSGSVTISSPAVSGTTTLTLPTTSGTVLTTASTDTVNSLNAGIGVNQTWQDVTASRAIGTTYTNSTGKPIVVAITYTNSAGTSVQGLTINGVVTYASGVTTAGTSGAGFTLIVPNGATYVTVSNTGTMTKVTWNELR
jgi:hypothetical protein